MSVINVKTLDEFNKYRNELGSLQGHPVHGHKQNNEEDLNNIFISTVDSDLSNTNKKAIVALMNYIGYNDSFENENYTSIFSLNFKDDLIPFTHAEVLKKYATLLYECHGKHTSPKFQNSFFQELILFIS
jgi:hypothetical protein